MKTYKTLLTIIFLFAISTSYYSTATVEIKQKMANNSVTNKKEHPKLLNTIKHQKGIMYDAKYAQKILRLKSGIDKIEKIEKNILILKQTLQQEELRKAEEIKIKEMVKDIMEKRASQAKTLEFLIKEIGVPEKLKSTKIGWYGARTAPWEKLKTEKDLEEITIMDEKKLNPFPDLIMAFKKFSLKEIKELKKNEANELLAHLRQLKLNPKITMEQREELKNKLDKAIDEKDFIYQKKDFKKLLENDIFFSKKRREDVVKDVEELNFQKNIIILEKNIKKLIK